MVGQCKIVMAELEIDREDIDDRKKLRNNFMKRKSNPIRKWTINRLYICLALSIRAHVHVF